MSTEMTYLAYTCLFTVIMWIPYILNMIKVRGLVRAVSYPDNPEPLAPWAQRMKMAHYNAVENLVVFAPLVIIVELTQANSDTTAMSCLVYLLARIAHYLCYSFAVPWMRTLTFAVSWLCLLSLFSAIFL